MNENEITQISSSSWKVGLDIVTKKQYGGYKCTCLDSRILGGKPKCLHIIALERKLNKTFYN